MAQRRAPRNGFDYRPLRDKWYREGWYSKRTCIDALKQGAAEHGDVAVVFVTEDSETTATVAEIHRAARAIAAGLQRLGVVPGDAVAVQLTNRLECAVALQAVLLCGAILVPIVYIYGPKEVGFIVAESAAKVFIMPARFRSTVYLDRIPEYTRIATLERIVVIDAPPGPEYLAGSCRRPRRLRRAVDGFRRGVRPCVYLGGHIRAQRCSAQPQFRARRTAHSARPHSRRARRCVARRLSGGPYWRCCASCCAR